jgi:hypothetical protein
LPRSQTTACGPTQLPWLKGQWMVGDKLLAATTLFTLKLRKEWMGEKSAHNLLNSMAAGM